MVKQINKTKLQWAVCLPDGGLCTGSGPCYTALHHLNQSLKTMKREGDSSSLLAPVWGYLFYTVPAAGPQGWSKLLLALPLLEPFKSLKRGSSTVAILSHSWLSLCAGIGPSWRQSRISLCRRCPHRRPSWCGAGGREQVKPLNMRHMSHLQGAQSQICSGQLRKVIIILLINCQL